MATTSLWRIHGKPEKVISYMENPDKTTETAGGDESRAVETALGYIMRGSATAGHQWISGINCDPHTASETMMNTKKTDGRTGGVTAYHGYQSFAGWEVSPDAAHSIGVELATRLWGERFEVVVATHVDKESHIHNHFVINTVPIDGGNKFHRTKADYLEMRKLSDQLCWEHGLSVIDPPARKGKQYSEWSAERNGKPTYRGMVRKDIDMAIKQSLTDREFFRILEQKGYEIKLRSAEGRKLKRPSLRPKGADRFFRFDSLGDEYSLDEISYRILENTRREVPFPEAEKEEVRTYRREHPPKTKHKGFAALYYHYCYELHIIEKHPASVKQMSFFMREDLRKLEKLDEQTRFLGANGIETIDDLNAYRDSAKERLKLLEWERQTHRNMLKQEVRKDDKDAQSESRAEIAGLTKEIRQLKKNLKTCDEAEVRAEKIREELDRMGAAETDRKEKGEDRDELFRRSSGTGGPHVPERS